MATKTTNNFPHDSNARNDEKLVRLRMRHGAAGYGVYFMILERLREEATYMSAKDYNMIAFDLRVDAQLIKSVVEDFGLFVFTEDGKYFYSESFLNRMVEKDNAVKKKSLAGKIAMKKRWQNNDKIVISNLSENDNTVITHLSENDNKKENKEKEKKDKKEKNQKKEENKEIKENKEKFSTTMNFINARDAREKEFRQKVDELKGESGWIDQLQVVFSLPRDKLVEQIDAFYSHCITQGEEDKHYTLSDLKRHFTNWLRIILNTDETNKQKRKNRRRADVYSTDEKKDYGSTF